MPDGKRITRRRWTAAEDQVVRDQYGHMSAAETGQLIDRTEDAVWDRARFLCLDKRDVPPPWTEAELNEVRRCYATERPAAIAKRLGRTTSALSQQAAVLGLVSRKTLITGQTVHDYFSDVADAEQAYILGLLSADGNIASEHPRVQLGLQAKDAWLVEWVRDRLNPGMSVSVRPDGHAVLMVTSAQMVADLSRYGVVPRKSRTLPWPAQLGDLRRPFLLGYFDGDGSACLARGKYPNWSVCSGSEAFLIGMKAYVQESTGVVMQKIQHRARSNLYQVATTGRQALVVDDWIHEDGFGLPRKRFSKEVAAYYLAKRS
jgi:hypothetical protein